MSRGRCSSRFETPLSRRGVSMAEDEANKPAVDAQPEADTGTEDAPVRRRKRARWDVPSEEAIAAAAAASANAPAAAAPSQAAAESSAAAATAAAAPAAAAPAAAAPAAGAVAPAAAGGDTMQARLQQATAMAAQMHAQAQATRQAQAAIQMQQMQQLMAGAPGAMQMQQLQMQQMQQMQAARARQAQLLGAGAGAGAAAPQAPNRIYVGSLHYDLTEPNIRAIFESFGPIRTVDMSWEPTTGKSKGFCFVECVPREESARAESARAGRG